MVIEPGSTVDPVTAPDQRGDPVRVDFEAPTVVFFYPRDGTPAATTEVGQFDALLDRYRAAGAAVYGVSTDDAAAHRAFADDEDLSVPLLADEDGAVAAAFDVPLEDGRPVRTTFALARRRVIGVYEGVQPDGHARHVFRDLAATDLIEV